MNDSARMPALFIGHGNPMNALADTPYGRAWNALGRTLPRPRAILTVSAHWYIEGTAVTAMAHPPTIHDFGGFPQALYDVRYPAPGDPRLAAQIAQSLAPTNVHLDSEWGLDHGAWSVLVHTHPDADIPVLQLSIDMTQPPAFHFELGSRLAPLRERGVLIVGSGNVVHNLRRMDFRARDPFEWSVRFDDYVREAFGTGDMRALVEYTKHPDARLAVPTPEHYLPLLFVAGLRQSGEPAGTIIEGFDAGSISMRAFRVG
ncbi:MAG: 4,5-DOPA-extradiol-dioxygenase [Vulcanimicrobiaceae bacterium]